MTLAEQLRAPGGVNKPSGMLPESVMERLVEKAWALHVGEIDAVCKWLVALGGEVIDRSEQISIRGPSGVTGGLVRGMDPVSCAAILGLLVLGQQWAYVAPELMLKVRKRWKAETKQSRAQRRGATA